MKNKRVGFVLSEDEKELLEKLAEREGGLSVGAYLRRMIYREGVKTGLLVDGTIIPNETYMVSEQVAPIFAVSEQGDR